jgi:hypothetical protein
MGGRSLSAPVCSAFVAASAIPTSVTTVLAAGNGTIVSQYTSIFTIVKNNVCRFCREASIHAEPILIHASDESVGKGGVRPVRPLANTKWADAFCWMSCAGRLKPSGMEDLRFEAMCVTIGQCSRDGLLPGLRHSPEDRR